MGCVGVLKCLYRGLIAFASIGQKIGQKIITDHQDFPRGKIRNEKNSTERRWRINISRVWKSLKTILGLHTKPLNCMRFRVNDLNHFFNRFDQQLTPHPVQFPLLLKHHPPSLFQSTRSHTTTSLPTILPLQYYTT